MDDHPAAAGELRRRLEERGWALARIDGASMEPALVQGDTVRLEAGDRVRPGDIATFELYDRLYTHRVVRVAGDTVFCRGDNHIWDDPGVPRSRVVGRVTEVVGRGPLPPVHATLSQVGLRRTLRRSRIRLRHVCGEVMLLYFQLVRGTSGFRGELSALGVPEYELGCEAQPIDLRDPRPRVIDLALGVETTVIPAGIYSRRRAPSAVSCCAEWSRTGSSYSRSLEN